MLHAPVLVTRAANDIFVEVHPDAYKRGADPLHEILEAAGVGGFVNSLDIDLINDAIRQRDGIARDVTYSAIYRVGMASA
jgi:hypothetical protein